MTKLLTALCFTCALAVAVQAEESTATKKKHQGKPLTAEQKATQKEILDKYDTNKDGKIDKGERAKISAEDKEKMEKAGLAPKKKARQKKDAAAQ
jgi:hypothetical protein